MQSAASTSGRGAAAGNGGASPLRSPGAAPPARRRGAGRARVVASSFSPDALLSGVHTASTVLSAGLIATGAWMLSRQLSVEQDQQQQNRSEACPRCNGSGYEPCLCARWSDGDVGCSTCNRTGYQSCRACGGGGMAVPLLRRAEKLPNNGGGGDSSNSSNRRL